MADISSAVITTFTGILGVIIGAIISNYVNQKLTRQSAKKDIIFKKKIEYYEKIVECIKKNTRLYQHTIKQLNLENPAELLKIVKEKRLKFDAMTSPLYLDTRKISLQIKEFVKVENKIFNCFEGIALKKEDKFIELKILFKELLILGNKIIFGLRKDLIKE